jgi:hypothetical protein
MRRSGVVTKMKMFLQSIFTLLVAVEGRSALRTAGLRLRALSQNPPAAPVARFSTKGEGGSPSPKDWMAFLSGIPAAAVVATATAGLAAAIGGDAHDDSTQDCTANAEPPQRVQPGARIGDEPESVTKPNDPVQELGTQPNPFLPISVAITRLVWQAWAQAKQDDDSPEPKPAERQKVGLRTSLARAGPNLDLIMGMPTGNSSRPGRFSASQSDTHE